MALVSLIGIDQAGDTIVGPGNPNWTWNGVPISIVGDTIKPHKAGPHIAAKITVGSPWMTIEGIPVTRAGSAASCGDVATGSAPMDIP
jgi:uncharacterized Zn-binding protein involved in type VI secretion